MVRRRLLVENLGDRRVLAAITGAVFEDANFSFQQDQQETALASRLIYIDSNANAELDAGERFVVAEPDGTFAFPGMADGTYLLRLFDGTSSQQQTSPIEATISGESVTVDGQQLILDGGNAISLTDQSIVFGDFQSGEGTDLSVATEVTKMQTLPDGTLLVIGNDVGGDTAWIVDPTDQSVTAVDLANNGQPIQWSDVAIDASGHGFLIEQSADLATVYAIDASDANAGIQVASLSRTVAPDAQVYASSTGPRSVFAQTSISGLELSLWSNPNGAPIDDVQADVADTFEVLAFDDASGLLVTRTFDGGVSIHDVNQNFATLHTMNDVTGPVAIDGARDLLLTISPVDSMLRMIDIRDGGLIASLAIDLSGIGQAVSIALGDRPDSIVVLGAAGMTEIGLNKASANRVQVTGGQDVDSVLFGLSLNGENTSPRYETLPDLATAEDTTLARPAPTALLGSGGNVGAVDAENDDFVLVQAGPASHGLAQIDVDGTIQYIPDPDYFGVDTVPVMLHDGRDVSDIVNLEISVTAVPDPPTDVEVHGDPIPEHTQPVAPVGDLEVIDVDRNGEHIVVIEDGRFKFINGQIIFVQGQLNFETEPFISILVNVTDTETGDTIERLVTLRVADQNDPIVSISPNVGEITENVFGDVAIAHLEVEDEDVGQSHQLTVDDSRFVIVGSELRLAADEALDFEEEQVVKVNVTATDGAGSSFTQEVTVQVVDVDEQPQTLELGGDTVTELEPGDVVGAVFVDGTTPNPRFELTVDDPRFEIVDATLKLLDDEYVELATQEEIQLTITVTDSQRTFDPLSETFVIQVQENQSPYHNDGNPYDVNYSGDVTTLDAALVINYLNTYGPGPVGQGDPGYGYDVNGDGMVTALDALLILNELSRLRTTGDSVGGRTSEGEEDPPIAGTNDSSRIEGERLSATDERTGIFNDWSRDEQIDAALPVANPPATPSVDHAAKAKVTGDFATHVDQTLRLLSDESDTD